jgi:hypothetical protein
MKKSFYLSYTLVVMTSIFTFVWFGCSEQTEPFTSTGQQEIESLGKRAEAPSLEVKPVFRMPTGRNSEHLTVFVYYEKGGKGGGGGKKPPKDDGGGEQCSDPNTNEAYSLIGPRWSAANISVAYQSAFEPEVVVGLAFGAIDNAFSAWEAAVLNSSFVNFAEDSQAPLPPERDGTNVVGWRQLVGRDARRVLAATYIWDDGNGSILEADILYNTTHEWAVNTAIAVHEIGHFIGLDHVNDDGVSGNGDETNATMAPTAAKGELKKQTLTPGDISGAGVVSPPAS